MKFSLVPMLFLASATLAAPAGAEVMVPAGSTLQCTISEAVSSKVTGVGDPVICQVSHTEMYGRFTFPYGSYLVGRFEEYKDPGHFVGKGWMELKFNHLVVGNDTVVPLNGRVIADSDKLPVDMEGKIHGKGHATKDTITWLIPILWPLDLINLPRRGPTPVLKAESRLTIKLMDDIGLPTRQQVQHQPELATRFNYSDTTPEPVQQQPMQQPQYQQPYQQQPVYQQQAPAPAAAAPTVIVVQAAPSGPMVVQQSQCGGGYSRPQQQRPVYNYPQQQPTYNYPPPTPPSYYPPASYRGGYYPY